MATKKVQEKSVTELLCERFKYSDIEFVIVNAFDYNSRNGYHIKAFALPYIKKESGEQRLDEVLGVDNWENDFTFPDPQGRLKYKIKFRVPGSDEWREKNEGATIDTSDRGQFSKTAFESGLAFAEKRCLAKLGIGRYLKLCPDMQVTISEMFEPGWNKYSFKSKVGNNEYVNFWWQDPMLPKEFLHPDEEDLAQPIDDAPQAKPKQKPKPQPDKEPATDKQWDVIESYYKALPLAEQEKWTTHLYTEHVNNESGSITNERKNISRAFGAKIIKSLESGYGELVNGHPSKITNPNPKKK